MGFASEWLEKNALFPQLIVEAPERQTGIIVTIPACNEPDITDLLDCLADCYKPECETEILIVVNAPADATENTIVNNKLTIKNIESWQEEYTYERHTNEFNHISNSANSSDNHSSWFNL